MGITRRDLLEVLIQMREPVSEVLQKLHSFGWDSEEPFITLMPKDVIAVLKKYLDGHIMSEEVQEWADAIHVRDDIALDSRNEQKLRDVLHELANPFLVQALTPASAQRLVECLSV